MRFTAAFTLSALVGMSVAASVPDVQARAVDAEDTQANTNAVIESGTCPVADNGGCGEKGCWCRDEDFDFDYAPCYPECGCPDGWTGWCN